MPSAQSLDDLFPRYTEFEPEVPVWCATGKWGRCLHRFFMTSPFSPSGRYLAVFRLPQEERPAEPGEAGEIVVIDLTTGEAEVVATTCGWENQLGANLQWGATDHDLFFNDVEVKEWEPFVVHLDPIAGKRRTLPGSVYAVSPDGKTIASSNLIKTRRTQSGYGVMVPDEVVGPRHVGFPDDDGFFLTDIATAERRIIRLRDIQADVGDQLDIKEPEAGGAYGFHLQWSPDGSRLMGSIRWVPSDHSDWNPSHDRLRFNILTFKPDGSDLHVAVPARYWEQGGHHTNWCPDNRTLLMNLGHYGRPLRLVTVHYDGSDLAPLFDEPCGSGHPTMHPDGRHILTDTYTREKPHAFGDGTIPLRWIDVKTRTEKVLVRINTQHGTDPKVGVMRVDAHPAWDRTHRFVAFNAYLEGTRQVMIADLSEVIG